MASLKQSTAYTRMFLLVDSADHVTGKTGVTPTVTLSKAGGAFGAAGGTITEVASGFYKIALTTTDTNTLGDLAYHATGTGCDPTDFVDQVSARLFDDLASPTNITAGTITTVTNLTNAPTAGDLTATMKASVTTAATAATPVAASVTGNVGGVATDGVSAAAVSAAAVTKIQSGLSTYAGGDTSGVTTLLSRLSAIRAGLLDNLDAAISTRLASAGYTAPLDAAGVRGAVGLATANLDTQLTTIDDFLDTEVAAIKAKTDALPASPAAVGSAMTLTSGERTSVADALLDRDLSAGTDTNTRSLRNALRFLRNKWTAALGVLTVKKEDDTTTAWTAALTTDAAAAPITGSDPT